MSVCHPCGSAKGAAVGRGGEWGKEWDGGGETPARRHSYNCSQNPAAISSPCTMEAPGASPSPPEQKRGNLKVLFWFFCFFFLPILHSPHHVADSRGDPKTRQAPIDPDNTAVLTILSQRPYRVTLMLVDPPLHTHTHSTET